MSFPSAAPKSIGVTDLGLQESMLLDAVRIGQIARGNCSPHHPPTYPGTSAWAETVRVLRDQHVPLGWTVNNDENFPTVVSPDGKIAIAVMTGDEGTGRLDHPVSTKSTRGPKTAAIVADNAQLDMFSLLGLKEKETTAGTPGATATWILLVYRSPKEIRCELSLPSVMGQGDKIEGWEHRIPLGSISLEPDAGFKSGPAPDFDVEIKRRA